MRERERRIEKKEIFREKNRSGKRDKTFQDETALSLPPLPSLLLVSRA